jgi:hypothetical protein
MLDMADRSDLHDEIRALLSAPANGNDAPSLSELEDTLTDGYARALALEGERRRLARRIGEVGIELGRGRDEHVTELASLAHRLDSADGDLTRLRELLGTLKQRAAEHRRSANRS